MDISKINDYVVSMFQSCVVVDVNFVLNFLVNTHTTALFQINGYCVFYTLMLNYCNHLLGVLSRTCLS